jgi:hypothetical protein
MLAPEVSAILVQLVANKRAAAVTPSGNFMGLFIVVRYPVKVVSNLR